MAQRVRGENNSGGNERLATQADQATANGYLNDIKGYDLSILSNLASIIVTKLLVSSGVSWAGVPIVGVGYEADNNGGSAMKFQTQHVEDIDITDASNTYDINLNAPSFNFCEINQLSIGGFNYAQDTGLLFNFYVNTRRYGYVRFFSWAVSPQSQNEEGLDASNVNMKFMPNIVAEWDSGNNRWGYIEVTPRGAATSPHHEFFVNITTTPFEVLQ